MSDLSELISADVAPRFDRQQHQHPEGALRVVVCGGVDDGRRTLIGRLARELDPLELVVGIDSKRGGTASGDRAESPLSIDGLEAGQEQRVTLAAAERHFSTAKRQFIFAGASDQEPDTCNLMTGASTADVAVVLVDARKGVLKQSRLQSYLISLSGIRNVVLAVNKMDLVNFGETAFRDIVEPYREFAGKVGLNMTAIPLSALHGDNLINPGEGMPWYHGPTLLGHLETVEVDRPCGRPCGFRLPVQWVNRRSGDLPGFSGTVVSGEVRPGDRVRVQPSGRESCVVRIVMGDRDLEVAKLHQSITLVLADDLDISQGDLISRTNDPAEVANQFEATVVWTDEAAMVPGRPYLFKLGPCTVGGTIAETKSRIDIDTMERHGAQALELDEVGVCNLALDRPVPFDPYRANHETGGFSVIDRVSNRTVGFGMLHFALRRSQNIHLQHTEVDKIARAGLKGQRPAVVWLTGLSGAGKSTIANLVEKRLLAMGRHSYLLDGDNVRHGLNRDLGFTDADRVENVRRVAEVARLMVDAGLIVITAFISPFRAERALARGLLGADEFIEVHVDTSLQRAESRDVKGLYQKARRGELRNFTGISSPYEAPESPELRIDTECCTPEEAMQQVISKLQALGLIG